MSAAAIYATQNGVQFKTWIAISGIFPLNMLGPRLTMGDCNHAKWNWRGRGTAVTHYNSNSELVLQTRKETASLGHITAPLACHCPDQHVLICFFHEAACEAQDRKACACISASALLHCVSLASGLSNLCLVFLICKANVVIALGYCENQWFCPCKVLRTAFGTMQVLGECWPRWHI